MVGMFFAGACGGLPGGARDKMSDTPTGGGPSGPWPAGSSFSGGWAHCWVLRQQAGALWCLGGGVLSPRLGGGVWCLSFG